MKILVELEFNEDNLGSKWMNPDNLDILLYTEASTKRDLLTVVSFVEQPPNQENTTEAQEMWQCKKCGATHFKSMRTVCGCDAPC